MYPFQCLAVTIRPCDRYRMHFESSTANGFPYCAKRDSTYKYISVIEYLRRMLFFMGFPSARINHNSFLLSLFYPVSPNFNLSQTGAIKLLFVAHEHSTSHLKENGVVAGGEEETRG